MPQYDWTSGEGLGSAEIYDVNGLRWDYVRECDTETGKIRRLRTDSDGGFITTWDGDVIEEIIYAPPPLFVKFKSEWK